MVGYPTRRSQAACFRRIAAVEQSVNDGSNTIMDVGSLRERRDRLANELGKLDALLVSIDAFVAEFDLEDVIAKARANGRVSAQIRSAKPAKTTEPTLTDLTADAAEAAIIAANAPVPLAKLEDAVRAAGVSLPNNDTVRNVLGARLYNSQRFIANRALGYWIKSRPMPGELDIAPSGANENGPLNGNSVNGPDTALTAH